MKFTEEQYQKIVEIQEESFPTTIISEGKHINDGGFWKVFSEKMPLLSEYVYNNDLHFELAALANPLTREWAHDKFVEKKYYWKNKQTNKQAYPMRLFRGAGGIVQMIGPKEALTESEIREWGYNPEMFDREEV